MLISHETIMWILTDGKNSAENISAIVKLLGGKLPESMKKNIQNAVSEKHKPRKTTISNFTNFFINLLKSQIIDPEYSRRVESFYKNFDLDKEYILYKWLESNYQAFFMINYGDKADDSFLWFEIKQVFKIYDEIAELMQQGKDKSIIENHLNENEFLSSLHIINKDVFINIRDSGKSATIFSLNLLLYLSMCYELELKISDPYSQHFLFSSIIDYLQDVDAKELNPAFAYFTNFVKESNPGLSFNKMAKELELEMDEREFDYYRSGERNVPIKKISIMKKTALEEYWFFVFWRNFMNAWVMDKKCCQLIQGNLLKNHEEFGAFALTRFEAFNAGRQKLGCRNLAT